MEKKYTAIILLTFLGLGALFGFLIEGSMNTFFSWVLIGLWLLFTIKFFEKIKKSREYNSPHNTSFFIFGPLFIGISYSFWGYYTIEILGWNLLEDILALYFSPWQLIFALPFLLYGIFSIRSLFKKYDFVYIIRYKSLKARKFAIIFIILILISVLFYIIFFNWIIGFLEPVVFPNYYYPFWSDLMFWTLIGFLGYLLIRHGIFGKNRSIPQITTDYIAQRRRQLERAATPAIASTASRQYTSSSSTPSTPRRPVVSTKSRTTPRRQKSSAPIRSTPTRPVTTSRRSFVPRRQDAKLAQSPKPSVNFNKLKPKAGILSLDDFKCIFCFQLPSNEDGRGIVLCPKCRHPAHVDEFQNWCKNSLLCSRCDGNIAANFRQNPVVVSARDYSEIINEFKKGTR